MSRRVLVLSIAGLLLVGLSCWWWLRPTDEDRLESARHALERGDAASADQSLSELLSRRPEWDAARVTAVRAALELADARRAHTLLKELSDDAPESTALRNSVAVALLEAGRLADATELDDELLAAEPDHAEARLRAASIASLQGRDQTAREHLLIGLRAPRFPVQHLFWMGRPASLADGKSGDVADWYERQPDDPGTALAEANRLGRANDPAGAAEVLREIVEARPEWWTARARLGVVLLELGEDEAAFEIVASTPSPSAELSAEDWAEVWFLRGAWLDRNADARGAARCFVEVLRRDPNHRVAAYRAGQLLSRIGSPAAAEFAEHAARLRELDLLVEQLADDPRDAGRLERVVVLQESLGRVWEAWAWSGVATAVPSCRGWAVPTRQRLRNSLDIDVPHTVATSSPVSLASLDELPIPTEWTKATSSKPGSTAEGGEIAFVDVADERGLRFRYENGQDPERVAMRLPEFTGGGVAVLDFDRDGRVDLFLPQGGPLPWSADPSASRDALFQQLADGTFRDVSSSAGVHIPEYGQGVAVGDVDGDGFDDVLVCNVGVDRLLLNNGDGTFEDVSGRTGLAGDEWSTSAAIADLDGDRLADLYVVAYLTGKGVRDRICVDENGIPRSCKPTLFPAAPDRVHFSNGDGTFREAAADHGIAAPDGRGLGVVVADLDEDRDLDVFVANDGVPNHHYVNEGSGKRPRFREFGFASGLACDRDGRAQACMGVAADDVDGDGRLDLFVTNFYDESNTLYRNVGDSAFEDVTREWRLREPSLPKLGFGTRFLDANLDGQLDLVVLNGHEGDYSDLGIPFRMTPQFHRGESAGFAELSAGDGLGPYFDVPSLGRGLARLDVDRDGLVDLVATHLDRPVSLLLNRSAAAGGFLAVQLVGVDSERTAIGARVVVEFDGVRRSRQLVAGDGYLVSNERVLVFATGMAATVDVSVTWPSGRVDVFEDVPTGGHILVVEGAQGPLQLPYAMPNVREG